LYGTIDHFVYTSVMPKVDDFAACALDNATHDIDRRVVPIK
jgi:hypothetical protein